jgi:hypothetical protein
MKVWIHVRKLYPYEHPHTHPYESMNTRTQTLPLWTSSNNWAGRSWSSRIHVRKPYPYEHLRMIEPVDLEYGYTYANSTPMSTSEGLSQQILKFTNTRTQTLPLWAPPKNWAGRSWSSWSHCRCLAVDGDVVYHLMHSAGKSWNKSRKMRTPVQVEDLNPGRLHIYC